MLLKHLRFCFVALYLFSINQVVVAAPSADRCILPVGLREQISKEYPDKRIVTIADLSDYNRKLFQKAHDGRCPGATKVNFYGDGKPTWAIALVWGDNPNRKAELLVAREMGVNWEIRSLDTTDGTPVVWHEGPGKYEDMYDKKETIAAANPVIVFTGYGSWSVLYAWTGKEVQKLQLSD